MPIISDQQLDALRNSVEELSALNEIAIAINLSMSVDKITQTILACCLKRILADQGAIFLLADDAARAGMFHTFVRQRTDLGRETPFHLNESLVGWMIRHKSLLVMNDPDNDERFAAVNFRKEGLTSLLAAPLISRDSLIGVLALFNKRVPSGFSENDKRFLGIVGTQTAMVITNAQLFEKEQELLTIQEEMRLARSIQENYLPRQGLAATDFEVLGFSSPAKEVGGDFWDMVRLSRNRIFFTVGDVSGKGVPAALLAAQSLAVIRSQLQTDPIVAIQVLAVRLNRLFFESSTPEQFMTCFLATYDTVKRCLYYINAGHAPPLVSSTDGSIRKLETANIVIGVDPDSSYAPGDVVLNTGDTVFVCTDGVTDNFGPNGEEYGDDRLRAFISSKRGFDLTTLCDSLVADLARFRQDTPQFDDITFLIMRAK